MSAARALCASPREFEVLVEMHGLQMRQAAGGRQPRRSQYAIGFSFLLLSLLLLPLSLLSSFLLLSLLLPPFPSFSLPPSWQPLSFLSFIGWLTCNAQSHGHYEDMRPEKENVPYY